ncbi:MAG: hypothetical protein Ct9H300mP17_06320 [Candidatus Nitrosopelagicus sp.]|nr:MAG: hypothetical protein Ct9H300mP17_06320 [Candidatus Nitrosopelagicus sp.]
MFNETDRIGLFVEMIMAESQEEETKYSKNYKITKNFFIGIQKGNGRIKKLQLDC